MKYVQCLLVAISVAACQGNNTASAPTRSTPSVLNPTSAVEQGKIRPHINVAADEVEALKQEILGNEIEVELVKDEVEALEQEVLGNEIEAYRVKQKLHRVEEALWWTTVELDHMYTSIGFLANLTACVAIAALVMAICARKSQPAVARVVGASDIEVGVVGEDVDAKSSGAL